MAYTHLIAIDTDSGMLWGGAPIAAGLDALRRDVAHYAPAVDGVTADDLWARCTVYSVVLGDSRDDAPAGAPASAKCVYNGQDMGWLPEDAEAAWGEKHA